MIKKICPRIITAANNLDRNLKVSVIATTEDKDDKVKDAFYVDLEDAVALIVLIFFCQSSREMSDFHKFVLGADVANIG